MLLQLFYLSEVSVPYADISMIVKDIKISDPRTTKKENIKNIHLEFEISALLLRNS